MRQHRQSLLLSLNYRLRGLACATACLLLAGISGPLGAQTPAEAVAAQVRTQGYQCDGPISATRDASLSKADMAVWNLKCKNGSYRVMLVPDMAARITKLDVNSK